ncbi:MAG: hypothetical protein RMK64_07210 [Rhodovarius sp.]|nr:hypothetical protein [Rhodovarius sp.]MCX7931423.1 hypothetical protein [Rhodovarius sp.]MDW8314741.1 hypothetical protein [Rhodovarius sp.]
MPRRPLLLATLLLVLAALLGLAWLAAFPPAVTPAVVERVLPNDRFTVR